MVKPDDSIFTEYLMLENRYAKLVLDGIEWKNLIDRDIKEYDNSEIHNPEYQRSIEDSVAYFTESTVRVNVARGKLDQICHEKLFELR